MKPEKQQLLQDLLDDQNRREATLFSGACVLRRRRRWRMAIRGVSVMAIVAGLVVWLGYEPSTPQSAQVSRLSQETAVQSQALTDDELLALFPDTPVGLATLPDGKKRLIFPRAGDEQKFVTRL